MARLLLAFELLVLFVGLPLGYRYSPVRLPALPVLWLVVGYAWWMLWHDAKFDRSKMWNPSPLLGQLGSITMIFLVVAAALWVGVRWYKPELEWSFVRENPVIWAAVMVLYPVLSVYPQGVLYRAFFIQRYAELFPEKWVMVLASALAFGFLHIIFRNSLAVGLTFAGGILFAARYMETGSLLTSSVEHALYGCWLFTVGLGQYFYHGRLPGGR